MKHSRVMAWRLILKKINLLANNGRKLSTKIEEPQDRDNIKSNSNNGSCRKTKNCLEREEHLP